MRLIGLGMLAMVIVGTLHSMEPAAKRRKISESISSGSEEKSYSSGSDRESTSGSSYSYYQIDRLKKLKDGQSRHGALVILADFDRDDNVQLVSDLTNVLGDQSSLILVSTNVLLGLLDTFNTILNNTWQVYDIPESDFVLLVGREWRGYYNSAGINFPSKQLVNIAKSKESLTNKSSISHERYKAYRAGKGQYKPFGFLATLFDTDRSASNNVTWDLLMVGHTGDVTKGEELVGVDLASLRSLFTFLDTKINTGIVLLSSCEIGGIPLNYIEVDNQVPQHHRFILIVGTTTDVPTTDIYDIPAFFNRAAMLDRGGQLNRLLNLLALDPMMIPQIWIPGVTGFFSLQTNPQIFLIGAVLEQAFALEKKPISIDDTRAIVLVRPVAIYPTVRVHHKKFDDLEPGSFAMANYLLYDSSTPPGPLRMLKEAVNHSSFGQLIEIMGLLRQKGYFAIFGKQRISQKNLDTLERSLYPMIIPLGRGATTTWYHAIELPDTTTISGVFDFMVQSFCYSINRTYSTMSLVDEIAGGNDIIFWREMITAVHLSNQLAALGQQSLSGASLEKWVYANPLVQSTHQFEYIGGKNTVTLSHASIINNPDGEREMTFILEGRAWSIRYSKDKLWYIQELPIAEYKRAYEQQKKIIQNKGRSVSKGQQSIVDVLKGFTQKKDTIKRKQEELIRQGLPSYMRK